MTRYAIGDIHGGAKTFRALLDRLNLGRDDRLYLLGDYVDRGNDSKGVLDIILDLMGAGYDMRPLLGNHDSMMLEAMQDGKSMNSLTWFEGWGWHTLASFDEMFMCDIPDAYRSLMKSMPTIYVEEDYVLVHAGLNMSKEDPVNQTSPYDMIWIESERVDSDKLGVRSLVTGHRIHSLDQIRASLNTNYIRLDNGAFSGMLPNYGHLVALNMGTRELITQEWLDGPSED